MKKSRYTEEPVAYALGLAESGTPVADVCRQTGIAEATFYLWKKRYAGMGISELRELRELRRRNKLLEQENEILRRATAYFARDVLPK